MKISKRISALLLAICLLAGMAIPMVSAEATTVTYDFRTKSYGITVSIDLEKANKELVNKLDALYADPSSPLNWTYKDKAYAADKADAWFPAHEYFRSRFVENGDWIAFTIDGPGAGNWKLTIANHACKYGVAKVNVYLLPGDTTDIGAALTAENLVGDYTCYDKSVSAHTPDEASNNINLITTEFSNLWLSGDDETHILVLRVAEASSSASYLYLSQLVLTPVAAEKEDEAKIGTKSYATLQAAIDEAKPEDEIVLQTAVEADEVTVPAGVTLNLNGQTLTAGEINIAGALVDTVGDGLLVTNTTITCSSDNGGYLPLTDSAAGGYRLCKPTLETLGKVPGNNGSAAYWFHAHFEKEAAYGYTGVEIGVQMTWDGGSKGAWANEEFMGNWATQVKADKDLDIKLTVTGLDDTVTNFKLTPVIKANGVTISMDTL